MVAEFRITRTEDFRRLARLAGTTARTLKSDLSDEVADVAAALGRKVSTSALQILPRRGGLARDVARSRYAIRTQVPTFGSEARVVFEASNRYNIVGIDLGRVRHPVFGNRATWVTQAVRQGFFTGVTDEQASPVRRALIRVMEAVRRRFDRL